MKRNSFFIFLTALIFIFAFVRMKNGILIVDEGNHFDQIMRFAGGDFRLNEILMTVPGYHFVIALLVRITGVSKLADVRLIAFVINLFLIPLFYTLVRFMDKGNAGRKTLQFAFLPVIFPFYFLIYTDIFSLIFILCAFYFVLKKNYGGAGLASTASLFIRQNNVFWLLFFNLLLYILMYGLPLRKTHLISHARKSIFFIGGVFLLSFLFLWMGGVVGSGYAKNFVHFSWTLFGNIYFFLFISFILFLPRQIAALPRVYTFLAGKKWMVAVLFLFYLFFLATFANDNPFNHTTWFIRNALLEFFTRDIFSKSVFFIFLLYSLLTYIVSPLRFRWGYLIYPFVVLYLLPYWLIETRYYFIPLTLFLILTKSENSRVEDVQTLWNILLSVYIFEGIVTLKFFL